MAKGCMTSLIVVALFALSVAGDPACGEPGTCDTTTEVSLLQHEFMMASISRINERLNKDHHAQTHASSKESNDERIQDGNGEEQRRHNDDDMQGVFTRVGANSQKLHDGIAPSIDRFEQLQQGGTVARARSRAHPRADMKQTSRAIPVLAFGAAMDPLGYMPRLLKSIDYPVQRIVIVVGNDDPQIVETLDRSIETTVQEQPEFLKGRVEVYRLPKNPGCARGQNAGLRAMMSNEDVKWALIANDDVIFNKDSLKSIYDHVEQQHDRNLGMLLTNLGWSAWAIFRSAVEKVGLVDENIWPAYFEDNDMMYRLQNAGLGIGSFDGARLGHADQQNVTHYVSGTELVIANTSGTQAGKHFASVKARTWDLNGEYVRQKWCHGCQDHGTYATPWNQPNLPLWEWKYEPARYAYYHSGEGNWTAMREVLDGARIERQVHLTGSSPYNYPLRLEDWLDAEQVEAKYY